MKFKKIETSRSVTYYILKSVFCFEIFVLLKLKLYKNKKYSKFIIRGRQRNPPKEGDIYLLEHAGNYKKTKNIANLL